MMLNMPARIVTPQAKRVALPEADRRAGWPLDSAKASAAAVHCETAVDGERATVRFQCDRPIPAVEPGLLLDQIDTAMRERRSEVANDGGRGIASDDCGRILVSMRTPKALEQGQDCTLGLHDWGGDPTSRHGNATPLSGASGSSDLEGNINVKPPLARARIELLAIALENWCSSGLMT